MTHPSRLHTNLIAAIADATHAIERGEITPDDLFFDPAFDDGYHAITLHGLASFTQMLDDLLERRCAHHQPHERHPDDDDVIF